MKKKIYSPEYIEKLRTAYDLNEEQIKFLIKYQSERQ